MVLLEELYPCGGKLCGLIYAQVTTSETEYFLLPVSLRSKALSYFFINKSVCMLFSSHSDDDNGVNG